MLRSRCNNLFQYILITINNCSLKKAHPDIMTMAKGIGNGMPLAAVATRKEIADKLSTKAHFNTFGFFFFKFMRFNFKIKFRRKPISLC